jgi:hypothetical protein
MQFHDSTTERKTMVRKHTATVDHVMTHLGYVRADGGQWERDKKHSLSGDTPTLSSPQSLPAYAYSASRRRGRRRSDRLAAVGMVDTSDADTQ